MQFIDSIPTNEKLKSHRILKPTQKSMIRVNEKEKERAYY